MLRLEQWMGIKRPQFVAGFWSITDMTERRKVLKEAKDGGSITPEVFAKMEEQVEAGRLRSAPVSLLRARASQWHGHHSKTSRCNVASATARRPSCVDYTAYLL